MMRCKNSAMGCASNGADSALEYIDSSETIACLCLDDKGRSIK